MPRIIALLTKALCCLLFSAFTSSSAIAQDYPARAVRIVVPFPVGSSADVQARQIAHLLSERFKQNFVVDNRPGANGMLGAAAVANAPPDGYTLLYATSHVITVNPHLAAERNADPLRDLAPIMITGSGPAFLVVPAASPYHSAQELIAAAKRAPGKLSYATSGLGSAQHIMGARLEQLAGIDLLDVPYKGETPALQDLMNGQIDFCFGFGTGTLPLVRGGKLRVLGTTSAQRLPALPDIAPLAEAGVAGYGEVTHSAYLAPRGTPRAIVQTLNGALREALQSLKHEIAARGSVLIASTPEQASAQLQADYQRYGELVKTLGLGQR